MRQHEGWFLRQDNHCHSFERSTAGQGRRSQLLSGQAILIGCSYIIAIATEEQYLMISMLTCKLVDKLIYI